MALELIALGVGVVLGIIIGSALPRLLGKVGRCAGSALRESPLAEVTDEPLSRVVGRRRGRTMRD